MFFEFQREHTSKAVCDMFRGFDGYIQADAHAVYDAVFRGEARASVDDKAPSEVGCWAHCRRRFWEAATITKDAATREGVLRLRVLLDDGRLCMTNNHSERALRSPICAGRKAWLFFGPDDHATAAANLLSLIASCLLHDIDPETYLSEIIIRIVPLWPKDRFLELAPDTGRPLGRASIPSSSSRSSGPCLSRRSLPPPRNSSCRRADRTLASMRVSLRRAAHYVEYGSRAPDTITPPCR